MRDDEQRNAQSSSVRHCGEQRQRLSRSDEERSPHAPISMNPASSVCHVASAYRSPLF